MKDSDDDFRYSVFRESVNVVSIKGEFYGRKFKDTEVNSICNTFKNVSDMDLNNCAYISHVALSKLTELPRLSLLKIVNCESLLIDHLPILSKFSHLRTLSISHSFKRSYEFREIALPYVRSEVLSQVLPTLTTVTNLYLDGWPLVLFFINVNITISLFIIFLGPQRTP